MNGTKIASLLLMMIIAGIAYGTQMMQKKTAAIKEEEQSASSDYQMADDSKNRTEKMLETRKGETEELRQFLATWTPVIERFQSGQEAEQAVMNSVRRSSLLALSQKFEVRENKGNPLVPKTLLATLTIQDEYAKTLNWFGDLERIIPVARVSSCHIKQGEGGRQVNVEVHIEVPLINAQAEFEDGSKKKK